jgi:putative transposase
MSIFIRHWLCILFLSMKSSLRRQIKLIVVSHRDQKTFQVAVMRYKNSFAYVQRQVDRLFRDLIFVKIFIDDIIIFFKNLANHLTHLRKMFFILIANEIFVNSKKVFLRYEFVQLLDQRVDSFELSTDEKKLKAIFKLKFSRTLKQLNTYLDLIDWMRRYVSHYSTVSQSLQNRKILLLKNFSIVESIRRKFFAFTRLLNSISVEKIAFDFIQHSLFRTRYLIHFDVKKQLYEDIDASKEFEIDVMIYHVEDDSFYDLKISSTWYSSKSKIQLILFLSRSLKSVERNYWSIELKIAEIVFIIRKIRHMIESVKKSIILFTDHDSTFDIVKQTSLLTIFTNKMNLRLIRAFEYIQRFNLIIKHKSDKQDIVLNALSRLDSENNELTSDSKELNALLITTLIEMNDDFRNKVISKYFSNLKWKKIQDTLEWNSSIKLLFVIDNQLIYRIDQIVIEHVYESRKLCISANIVRDILHLTHFDNYYSEFVKCFDIVSSSWYIHELFKHLREYLRHCSQCQIFQIRRHKSYESLQSILMSKISFHILTMNFVLALSISHSNKFDSAMFITCKFFKRVTIILDKTIWKVKDWVLKLLNQLKIMNWELLKTIISNRDVKFLSKLWNTWFNKLDVRFLYFIVYHSQSNDRFEQSN